MEILKVDSPSEWVLDGLNALLPQLSGKADLLGSNELARIVASDCTTLLIAAEGHKVLGSLTLAIFRIPTGLRVRIEDVVVDGSARGRGIGELLMRRALELARAKGADTIDLTSRRTRVAANRLYRKLGFVVRDTNTYQYTSRQA